jgi:hypothetical protein
MKLRTILATAILSASVFSLPSMASVSQTVSPAGGPWAINQAFGCTWAVIYSNGGTSYEYAVYRPVGACQYSGMTYSYYFGNSYATITAS